MDELGNLLAVDEKETLRFFYSGLRGTSVAQNLAQIEALHVASVLAHYAQVSVHAPASALPAPTGLGQVLDRHILYPQVVSDPEILRIAAAECLFILGFFSTQMKRRHNLNWFEQCGRGYYMRASYFSEAQRERKLLWKMSLNFALWVEACQEFRRNLTEEPLIIS